MPPAFTSQHCHPTCWYLTLSICHHQTSFSVAFTSHLHVLERDVIFPRQRHREPHTTSTAPAHEPLATARPPSTPTSAFAIFPHGK